LTVFLFAETTVATTTGRSLSSQSGETTASPLSTVTSGSNSPASTTGSSQGTLPTGTPSVTSESSQGTLTTGTSSATSGSNQGTLSSGTPSVTTGSSQGTLTTGTPPATTTKTCEVMQAVDESISKQITVTPVELPNGTNIEFQPTSTSGVSFPKGDETPTITVNFGKPTEVHSVTIPRDKTPNANVQQFEVTFYSPNGKKDNESPKGVILNIIACTEITTG
jgi:hypothetical protein